MSHHDDLPMHGKRILHLLVKRHLFDGVSGLLIAQHELTERIDVVPADLEHEGPSFFRSRLEL
jgi:hypothetical protein